MTLGYHNRKADPISHLHWHVAEMGNTLLYLYMKTLQIRPIHAALATST